MMISPFVLTKGTPVYEQSQLQRSGKALEAPLRMAWE